MRSFARTQKIPGVLSAQGMETVSADSADAGMMDTLDHFVENAIHARISVLA